MRKLLNYFLRRKRRLPNVPRQYIEHVYNFDEATDEQKKLMIAGKARTPKEAQRLLEKFQTRYASVVIDLIPLRKRTFWQIFEDRLKTLVNRMEGSSRFNPVYKHAKSMNPDALNVEYKFERVDNDKR